jgi:hypothetical protein
MPPGGLDPQYGHFVDNYTLTQAEIDTIARWADSGAVEGEAKDAPPPVQWVDNWLPVGTGSPNGCACWMNF